MAITKQDIDNVSLTLVNEGQPDEGYDPEEVDLLLEHIGEEVDAFNRALVAAAARIESAERRAQAAELQASQNAQLAQSTSTSGASENQIAQALIAAQKSADDLRDAARVESEKAYREAEKRARDIVRDALSEKQRIIDTSDRLRESTEAFRSEYLALLNRFSGEAQKTMPKLVDSAPDFSEEKKANADALQVLKEGDAAFEAPEPEPAPAAGAISEAHDPFAPSTNYAGSLSANQPQRATPVQSVQPSFELDEDLDIDIEEID